MKKNTKTSRTDRPAHSGFEAPAYGIVYPKGTTWTKNPDGTLSAPVLPKDTKKPAKKK